MGKGKERRVNQEERKGERVRGGNVELTVRNLHFHPFDDRCV